MFCLNQIWMCFNSLLSVLVFYKHWDLGLSKLDYFGFSSLNTATVYRNALRCWVVCLFKCLFLVFYIYVRVIPASLSLIKSESECSFCVCSSASGRVEETRGRSFLHRRLRLQPSYPKPGSDMSFYFSFSIYDALFRPGIVTFCEMTLSPIFY